MLSDTIRKGDWEKEKHVPVIEYKKKGDLLEVEVSVGKEIPHPNTPEHHIEWIELYFKPEDGNFPILIGRVNFDSHEKIITEPRAKFYCKCNEKGKLMALSYCTIHGLWQNEIELK